MAATAPVIVLPSIPDLFPEYVKPRGVPPSQNPAALGKSHPSPSHNEPSRPRTKRPRHTSPTHADGAAAAEFLPSPVSRLSHSPVIGSGSTPNNSSFNDVVEAANHLRETVQSAQQPQGSSQYSYRRDAFPLPTSFLRPHFQRQLQHAPPLSQPLDEHDDAHAAALIVYLPVPYT
ncbi:hypothetical protein R3P38DRAFT_2804568 [Favolaschia claudopus]|uniref:Uncharacterized protein n=1 Tax=Favolaschia claudopus TaxID=2862362 RepID=A0AAV9ZPU3_9AGAR